MEGHPLDVEPREQLRREMEARRSAPLPSPASSRVDGLIAPRIGERLVDVGRQRRLAGGLALEPDAPASLAERLEQLDRPEPLARRAAAARAARAPPRHRRRASRPGAPRPRRRSRAGRQPRGHDPRVVDDDELPSSSSGSSAKPRWRTVAGRAVVDEQPRGVAPLGRMLGDQLRRQRVVELVRSHPTARVALRPWTNRHWNGRSSASREARDGPATRRAASRRPSSARATRSRRSAPRRWSSRRRCRIASATPCRRAAARGAAGGAEPRRDQGSAQQRDLAARAARAGADAERNARLDDLTLLVDLISTGWQGVDRRLERIECGETAEVVALQDHVAAAS